MTPRARTLIFCVSEMAPTLLERWRRDLPTLSALAEQGFLTNTRYDVPYYLTPQMWATIHSGATPGGHGIFDYRQRMEDGQFHETSGRDIMLKPWWEFAEKAGRRVGVVNLPLTYPPRIENGFMISGQDAPGGHPSIMSPRSLHDALEARFGRYHIKDIFPGGQDRAKYAKIVADELARQAEVYAWIAREQDWDCLVLYTSGAAMAQHYFWSDMEDQTEHGGVVKDTFVAIDRMIGGVIAARGDSPLNVCVISECGAGPLAHGVNLNAALKEWGFLHYLGQGEGRQAGRRIERSILSSIRRAAQRALPKSLFYAANRSFLRKWILGRLATQGIDWSRTKAFHRGKGEGNIYLNLKGRDPNGIVTEMERDALIADLSTRLRELRTPEGIHPVKAVHRREDLFHGPFVERAPDLVIEWLDAAFMPSERDHENEPLFGERWREYMSWPTSGSHRPEGVLIAAGPDIEASADAETVSLVDLAPLWLALNGVARPASMEGTLRADLLRDAREARLA